MVNILVVGSGGREHALCWKLSQSPSVDKVFSAPGNGGTPNNVQISVDDVEGLTKFAKENGCFTVVGPEAPLALGLVDKLKGMGLGVFGPTKDAAQLESSKIWAKQFMQRNNIPTSPFGVFESPSEAKEYVSSLDYDVVVKADGLASGKGVIVCSSRQEAFDAIDDMLVRGTFGSAGKKIIIEQRLDGTEASYIALCDGKTAIPMATSQDHKRVFDNDEGPNTGGMGAYSPTGAIDEEMGKKIQRQIIEKTVNSMAEEGIMFSGFLYAGIMIHDGAPYVLEFNARMGDPECQPILVRMESDLYDYLRASSAGNLDALPQISWKPMAAVCIVLASEGYPGTYQKNEQIQGLDKAGSENVVVFHAGTKREDGKILTNGGRVLGVTALGKTLQEAITTAYSAADLISWKSKFCRNDIGKKGLRYL